MKTKKMFCAMVVAGMVSLCGCASFSKPAAVNNVFIHPQFEKMKIHDIAVIQFANESASKKDVGGVATSLFVSEFNKRGLYILHPVDAQDVNTYRKLMHIDAVLKARIIEYRDVEPLRFGIHIVLADLDTGETLWSAQEIFDAASTATVDSVQKYYASVVEHAHPIMGYKLYLLSMNKFMEFAAYQIVNTIDQKVRPK